MGNFRRESVAVGHRRLVRRLLETGCTRRGGSLLVVRPAKRDRFGDATRAVFRLRFREKRVEIVDDGSSLSLGAGGFGFGAVRGQRVPIHGGFLLFDAERAVVGPVAGRAPRRRTKPRVGEPRRVRLVRRRQRRAGGGRRRGRRGDLIPGHGTVAFVFAQRGERRGFRGFREFRGFGFGVAESRGDEISPGFAATTGHGDGGVRRRRAQPAGRREAGVLGVLGVLAAARAVRAAIHLGHLVLVRLAVPLGELGGGVEVQDGGGAERLGGGGCSGGRGGGMGTVPATTGGGGGDVARGGPHASLAVAETVDGAGGVAGGVSRSLGDGDRAAGERGAGVERGAPAAARGGGGEGPRGGEPAAEGGERAVRADAHGGDAGEREGAHGGDAEGDAEGGAPERGARLGSVRIIRAKPLAARSLRGGQKPVRLHDDVPR